MGIETKNPIKKDELEAFRKSLKIGDWLIFYESVPRNDGVGGSRMVKRRMQVTGVYKHLITLQLGRIQRSMTIQEALLYNVKRRKKQEAVVQSQEEMVEERRKKIMHMVYRGMSNDEIAEKTGYSRKTVASVIRSAKQKNKKISEKHMRIIKLKASGHGVNEIARMVGCSSSTVIRVVKKNEAKNECTA